MSNSVIVLGIETSCDETAVALYDTKVGLLTHQVSSQIALHNAYGGVVPELASRDHIKKLLALLALVLKTASLSRSDIDGIAYTQGPGLVGALMVGAAVAQGLALSLGCPVIGVHHLEGHLLAPFLEENKPTFPFLALLVSGGHTLLARVDAIGQYTLLGQSVDDAAGEAFDKTAKIMGLPYPGGPHLAALAALGNAKRFSLPRPLLKEDHLNFSFSGLKTAAWRVFNDRDALDEADEARYKKDLAASFQSAVVETLVSKCAQALTKTGLKQLVIAGGVSANHLLRQCVTTLGQTAGVAVFYPRLEFCTDNAAMIAFAGAQRLVKGQKSPTTLDVFARGPLVGNTALD